MPAAADQTHAAAPRIGFAGTPEFAASILRALLDAGHRPVVVYCQPDRPGGRGRRLQASPVKVLAQQHGLAVRQPASLRSAEAAAALRALHLDLLVVVAYGLILPPAFLEAPRFGCVNVHASLLPRWRGAAPIERAILAGDSRTGVSIMQMDRGLDTGPVILQRACDITPDTNAPTLAGTLADLGASALLDCLKRPLPWPSTAQPAHGVCYADKLTRADARVSWGAPVRDIRRQVLALAGRMPPVAGVDDHRMKILDARAIDGDPAAPPGTVLQADATGVRVACGDGSLLITRLQLNLGKGRPLAAGDAVNGYPALFRPGSRFRDGP